MKVNFILLIALVALGSRYVKAAADRKLYVWAHPDPDCWSDEFYATHSDWEMVNIGTDYDDYNHFVGRALVEGELLPGKWEFVQNWWQKIFNNGTYKIWVALGSKEYETRDFESLWVHPCAGSYIELINPSVPWTLRPPEDAVVGGYTWDREPIFIGSLAMATKDGRITVPSKIIRSERKMYGTYDGGVKEGPIKNYVVVRRKKQCNI